MRPPNEPLLDSGVLGPTVRRRTLVVGALGTAFAASVSAGRPAWAATRGQSRASYAAASWRALVGRALPTPTGPVRLASIIEQEGGVYEAFQLRFVTVDRQAMPEQLVVTHPRHGPVAFFVTASEGTGVAVVNRRRS